MKIALLAGTQSGCGKTTIMLALLQYFKTLNIRITPFKAGPDFLDPLWHQLVSGRVSYNLDTQMIGLEQSRQLINKQKKQTDIALIEGVMGLFDGRTGIGKEGSGADLAKGLACPVILVVNAKGMSGSIAPLVSGFCTYAGKMGVKISGIIANQVGSQHHAELLRNFLLNEKLPPLIAWMKKEVPVLPERHLGLVMPENDELPDFLPFFHVDRKILFLAFSDWRKVNEVSFQPAKLLSGKKIAIVKDAACCFIYPANIDSLLEQDAKLGYFSVLRGEAVPQDADALWIPGGYPELYGQQLSVSASWKSIKQFIEAGKPVLAECGGIMLLGKKLIVHNGTVWPMASILSYTCKMQKKLASLGYREESSGMKGHEFHYSVRESEEDYQRCFDCSRGDSGIRHQNLRASYIHWYFASCPEVMAEWLSKMLDV